ncbi:hypothetical protein ACIPJG_32565 [Streptomyces halstedii]|uniref:DUF7574 domain-containing protein n=1 Tax=Streptomyces halstedii TaxID=1944 RepID=UPI00382E3747
MSYDTNVYYNPGATGLTTVGEVDTDGGYGFDMLVVWQRDEDGALFWATDSGCSCPSPFDACNSPDDLTAITNVREFSSAARGWFREQYSPSMDNRDALERLIRKVQRLAKKLEAAA